MNERASIIFDLVASLSHKPWEFSRNGKFNSKVSNIQFNQNHWTEHIQHAKEELNELIEHTLLAKGDSEDIEIARNALADDNAPAVMRALARIEAESIGARHARVGCREHFDVCRYERGLKHLA